MADISGAHQHWSPNTASIVRTCGRYMPRPNVSPKQNKIHEFVESKLKQALFNMGLYKAGPDIIQPIALKMVCPYLSFELLRIYSVCSHNSYVSLLWRNAAVCILRKPKSLNYSVPITYRPIASTSVVRKDFWKNVDSRVVTYSYA